MDYHKKNAEITMKKWKLSWKLVVLSMLVTILVFGLVWGLVIVEKNVTTDDFDKTIRLWGEKDVRYLNVKLLGNKYTIDFSFPLSLLLISSFFIYLCTKIKRTKKTDA